MSQPVSPLLMPQKRPVAPRLPSREEVNSVAAVVTELTPGKIVRPIGKRHVLVERLDDGVRKAKQLQPGMRVRPYIKGEARGGERVVETVERVEDDTLVRISFSTGHPTQDYKPAYRFVHLDAIGQVIQVREQAPPGFVEVR